MNRLILPLLFALHWSPSTVFCEQVIPQQLAVVAVRPGARPDVEVTEIRENLLRAGLAAIPTKPGKKFGLLRDTSIQVLPLDDDFDYARKRVPSTPVHLLAYCHLGSLESLHELTTLLSPIRQRRGYPPNTELSVWVDFTADADLRLTNSIQSLFPKDDPKLAAKTQFIFCQRRPGKKRGKTSIRFSDRLRHATTIHFEQADENADQQLSAEELVGYLSMSDPTSTFTHYHPTKAAPQLFAYQNPDVDEVIRDLGDYLRLLAGQDRIQVERFRIRGAKKNELLDTYSPYISKRLRLMFKGHQPEAKSVLNVNGELQFVDRESAVLHVTADSKRGERPHNKQFKINFTEPSMIYVSMGAQMHQDLVNDVIREPKENEHGQGENRNVALVRPAANDARKIPFEELVDVQIQVTNRAKPTTVTRTGESKTHLLAHLQAGDQYRVVIENKSDELLFLRLLVDGRDTLPNSRNGITLLSQASCWVCYPRQKYAFNGFYHSFNRQGQHMVGRGNRFQVAKIGEPLEAGTEQLGIITASFYQATDRGPRGMEVGRVKTVNGPGMVNQIKKYTGDKVAGDEIDTVYIHYGFEVANKGT